MKVLKFGGTSVGSAGRISGVADLLMHSHGVSIVVLSAMSGITNALVEINNLIATGAVESAYKATRELFDKYSAVHSELLGDGDDAASEAIDGSRRTIEACIGMPYTAARAKEIVAQGELMSTALMLEVLLRRGCKAAMLPALDFMRLDADGLPDPDATSVLLSVLLSQMPDVDVFITQGFICRNIRGEVDNLQRGGSDYTATIIGACADADEIQIWTDIDGMHNNDPRFIDGTHPVRHISFDQAAELAYFGAKILHPDCMLPARRLNIPVRLLNTMDPEAPGTLIDNIPGSEAVKAVSARDNISLIHISPAQTFAVETFLARVFITLEAFGTTSHLCVSSADDITVAVDGNMVPGELLADLRAFANVRVDPDKVIIGVVGDMESCAADTAAAVCRAMNGITLHMVSYGATGVAVSLVVDASQKIPALQALSAHLMP